ncbi:NAD(P)/FAD-dependent oxidoreductase [uncultured Rhodoblastus sp.]|uniref:NAD(P)/FAD-dependent oxidoreductase n=1 Tax=uncultured Rhodoblastus sp. TaxID=543037 RepID=UPI0025E194DF|nr:NAD(P)/FAD-dependent oxidoreductase [uncultured Rhodoblastus sp.]
MEAEAVVIGAGVVGLAVARRLAEAGRELIVLEAENTIGSQTSSRNSEVIHAGLYYPRDSLKARACVAGRKKLYAYCESRKIPARNIGKLIVAAAPAQEARLAGLLRQGLENGVDDLRWLDGAEAARIEPEVRAHAALHSPSTGIIDSAALMLSLQADAENSGAQFAFRSKVTRIDRSGGRFAVFTEDSANEPLLCRILVNCAGHGAHGVARAMEGYPSELVPPRFLAKGNYCSVSGRSPFSHLVYPLPAPGSLGVHVALDLAGNMRLGPDLHWVDELDYRPTPGVEPAFRDAVAQFWPGILSRDIAVASCGVRPKIGGPGEAAADFRLDGPRRHGIGGLVHCFGIESPGLTSSLALADLIAAQLGAE